MAARSEQVRGDGARPKGSSAQEGTAQGHAELCSYSARQWPEVAADWEYLHRTSPYATVFLSPEWVSTWIETFGPVLNPEIIVFRSEEFAVGCCLIVRKATRLGPFRVRQVYLNTAGEDASDSVYVEFNDLLCLAGYENMVALALASHLDSIGWDELVIPGFRDGSPLTAIREVFPAGPRVERTVQSHVVDLEVLRRRKAAFRDTLARRVGKQLRQSWRLYSARGEIHTRTPADRNHALAMLERLAQLNRERWSETGQSSAFSSTQFVDFHRRLVSRALMTGRVQLIEVYAGDELIGVTYNLLDTDCVYFYQSGLNYPSENRLKPGFVCQASAIDYWARQGFQYYDFMAGDEVYKRQLGGKNRELLWLSIWRSTAKSHLIDVIRGVRRRLRQWRRS